MKYKGNALAAGTNDAVCVVGMHRCGTSVTTKIIELAGVSLGAQQESGSDNPTGFWETPRLRAINEEILTRFGGSWSNPPSFEPGWVDDPALADLHARARRFISAEYSSCGTWGWKDPRTALTLPFWKRVVPHLKYIICIRNPLAVADSVVKRDRLPRETALELWFDYTTAALYHTRNESRAIVHYEDLLDDWIGAIRRISDTLELGLRDPELIRAEVAQLVDPELCHHRYDLSDALEADNLAFHSKSIYLALRRVHPSSDEELRALVESVAREREEPSSATLTGHDDFSDRSRLALEWMKESIAQARERPELIAHLVLRVHNELGKGSENDSRLRHALTNMWVRARAQTSELTESLGDAPSERDAALLREARFRVNATHVHESFVRLQERMREELAHREEEASRMLEQPKEAPRRGNANARDLKTQVVHARTEKSRLALRRVFANTEAATEHRLATSEALNVRMRGTLNQAVWLAMQRVSRAMPLGGRLRRLLGDSFFWIVRKVSPDSAHANEYAEAQRFRARRKPPTLDGFAPVETPGPRPYDVFVFSVIDWHSRRRRPQHLARQLAQRGHRVFYVSAAFTSGAREQRSTPEFVAENICLVAIPCSGSPPVTYDGMLTPEQLDVMSDDLAAIREEFDTGATVSMVDHAFWQPLISDLSNNVTLYDCMDHHEGSSNAFMSILRPDQELVRSADLVTCTSRLVRDSVRKERQDPILLPNGAEYEHFTREAGKSASTTEQPVIGYLGAVADWFDTELLACAARAISDCRFVLVGSTFGGDLSPLEGLSNVELTGNVAHSELPTHLHTFDVCVIPFKLTKLKLAASQVNVYEYLSSGKPVVATRLPELEPMVEFVRLTDGPDDFVAAVRAALKDRDPGRAEARRAFAKDNSWTKRGEALESALDVLYPKVSVIVLTHNQLEFTKACLRSLDVFTRYPDWELIIVDNASSDGTPSYLRRFAATRPHVRVILNEENRGFAGGNNQGAAAADGAHFIFLNNDTFVTAGWVTDLLAHLRAEPSLGLLNPVTNNIRNEARIDIQYADMRSMAERARHYTSRRRGQRTSMRMAAFFCVVVPRGVWEEVGELDIGYDVGYFEDDDYAMRVRQAGYQIACAEDVFVHHHLSASFSMLDQAKRDEVFARNKRYYESKWGRWISHEYRPMSAGAP